MNYVDMNANGWYRLVAFYDMQKALFATQLSIQARQAGIACERHEMRIVMYMYSKLVT